MAEIDAVQEETIFVNLFKNEYEAQGKKFVSYRPWYIPKGETSAANHKTFPIGFGEFTETPQEDSDYMKKEYTRKFRLSVAVNEVTPEENGELVLTLNEVDTKEYKKYFLRKKINAEGKTTFGVEKPIEVAGTKYRANLTQNKKEDKLHLFNLIFKAAEGGAVGWSEKEISFGADDDVVF